VTVARRLALRVVAIGVAASPLAACGGDGEATIEVTAMFDSAVGVYPTGDVVVLDHAVGTIEAVELDGDAVRLELRVRADVPLPADVHASIEAETVLGERRIVLSPPWNSEREASGAQRLRDGDVIPADRTSSPTEPDEALQAFNQLLSSLDPDTVGGLVSDGADLLEGRGDELGRAIDASASLASTLATVDQPLLDTAASLNQLAGVLNERDAQLRSLIDGFGSATGILADEQAQVDTFLTSLAELSGQVDGLLDTHAQQLPAMLATLTATLQVVQSNADTLPVLTSTLPVVAESFEAAYRPEIGGFFLKVNTLAVLETVVVQLLDAVGIYPGTV
jgi:virulence factor Mce-like protein